MLSRHRFRRAAFGLLIAVAGLLCLTASSQAAGLTQSASNCGNPTTSQIFAPWGDIAHYDLAPGGSFEAGSPAWNLTSGAATVAGNESFSVNAATDSQSLSLPAGSSATSPSFCVGIQNPTIRLFAQNTGDPTSTLAVSVHFITSTGTPATAQIATITAGGTWQPTAALPLLVNNLTLLPGNQTPVSLTFAPQGQGGNWQIDDVYVDPFGRS